jgi:ABC-2 type transport system ATP-binding protein
VTILSPGDPDELARVLAEGIEGVARSRPIEGGVEVHVNGEDRLLPRVVELADRAGIPVLDLSVTEPTLETVFINLTGKELRD